MNLIQCTWICTRHLPPLTFGEIYDDVTREAEVYFGWSGRRIEMARFMRRKNYIHDLDVAFARLNNEALK